MADIIFLDGGLGQEINKRSSKTKSHPLWSLKVMYDEPEIVSKVHLDFINAGAKVLSLNTYTATLPRLEKYEVSKGLQYTHKLAYTVMQNAIEKSNIDRKAIDVAGCLPPLVASYIASEALPFNECVVQFQKLINAQRKYVDLFLVETMSNISEAKAAIMALHSFDLPAIVGLTISDDFSNTLRSGEKLELAVEQLAENGVSALMLNCSFPESIDYAIPILADTGLPFGAYANGFTSVKNLIPGSTVDNLSARQDLSKIKYSEFVCKWVGLGASLIGGCCEIGPDYISHLRKVLVQDGHNLISASQSGILS